MIDLLSFFPPGSFLFPFPRWVIPQTTSLLFFNFPPFHLKLPAHVSQLISLVGDPPLLPFSYSIPLKVSEPDCVCAPKRPRLFYFLFGAYAVLFSVDISLESSDSFLFLSSGFDVHFLRLYGFHSRDPGPSLFLFLQFFLLHTLCRWWLCPPFVSQ